MLSSAVEYFIPEKVKSDVSLYRKYRFFLISAFTTLFLSILYIIFFYWIEFIPGLYIVAGYIFSHFLFLFLCRKKVSLYIIGNLYALMTYVGFTYGAATSGGVSSAVIAWLLSTKVSSFWYGDRRSGYTWSVVTILTVTILLIFELNGTKFPFMYKEVYKPYFSGTLHIGVLIYYVVVLKVYEDWKEYSIKVLQKTVESKENLMQAIAHDLRNPLQIMILKINALKRVDDIQSLKDEIQSLKKQTERLVNITNELVSNDGAVKNGLLDIKKYFDSLVLNEFTDFAATKNIKLLQSFELDKELFEINDVKLQRILQNIVSNSIKYSPEKTSIYINTKLSNKTLSIEVKDEGLGLSQNELEIIFERFSGIENKPTNGESSIGIGLSITKVLVESLNGEISVSSPGKNKGTTIHLKFFEK